MAFGSLLRIQLQPYGDWNVIQRQFVRGGFKKNVAYVMTKVPERYARIAEAQIASSLLTARYDQIRSGASVLSEVTVMLKGHSIPLIQSRQLYRSITSKRLESGAWFAGVDPEAFHTGANMPMWKLALIQEGGISIRVTDKMRKWFSTKGIFLRGDKSAITIPSRPFIRQGVLDTMKKLRSELKNTANEISSLLRR